MSFNASLPPAFDIEYVTADKGPRTLAIITVFPSLALLIVGLRLYTRFAVVRNASYEDLAIVLALVFSIATSICQGYQVKNGMGRHIPFVTQEQGINSQKALFASIMMYSFSLTCTKVSIVVQYLRISIDRKVRIACWVVMAILMSLWIEALFANIFACYPIPKFWDYRIPGTCINKSAMYYANAVISIVTDFALVIIPIFIVKKLQLRGREKYTLALILGLGGFASIASILRLGALSKLEKTRDPTWDSPGTATWSVVEMNLGIICASLPTLRAFVMQHFPRMLRSFRGSTRDGKAGTKTSDGKSGVVQENEGGAVQGNASELAHIPPGRSSVATNTSDPFRDVEKGRETFFSSDSENE